MSSVLKKMGCFLNEIVRGWPWRQALWDLLRVRGIVREVILLKESVILLGVPGGLMGEVS